MTVEGAEGGKVWGYEPNSVNPKKSVEKWDFFGLWAGLFVILSIVACIAITLLYTISAEDEKGVEFRFLVSFAFCIALTVIFSIVLTIKSKVPFHAGLLLVASSIILSGSLMNEIKNGHLNSMSTSEVQSEAYQKEYGYTDVTFPNILDQESKAEVVTEQGNTIEVGAIKYEGHVILFETREQLLEKMDEVDAGTYPEDL